MFFFSKESNKLYPNNNYFGGGRNGCCGGWLFFKQDSPTAPPSPSLPPPRTLSPSPVWSGSCCPQACSFCLLGLESEFLGWVLHLQWTQNPRPAARFPHSSGGIPYSKEIKAAPKEINPEHVLEGLKLKLQYFGCLT